jgi:AMP deaminase
LFKKIYKLPQSELARNSVIQSGFEMEIKRHWLGKEWYLPGSAGNNMEKVRRFSRSCILSSSLLLKTNVPDIRLDYRHQTLQEELDLIRNGSASAADLDGLQLNCSK